MVDWLKAIQLNPRFLFGAFLLTAFLLFAPADFLSKFGLTIQESNWQPIIGLLCIGSFVFWLVQMVPVFDRWSQEKKFKKQIFDRLNSLSWDEWTILWYCLDKNQQTVGLSAADKLATSLVSKGILYLPPGNYSILAYPYSVPDFLWKYLRKNKDSIFSEIPLPEDELYARILGLEQHIHRHDF